MRITKKLNLFANEITDNEATEQLNSAQYELFNQLQERQKTGTQRAGLQAHLSIGKYAITF
jgi:hypothetical protein